MQLCKNTLSIIVVTGYIYFSFTYCCHKHWGYFQKCPFLGHMNRSGGLLKFTFVRRRPSSVSNFRKLTSWKLQGQLLLLFGTLLPLRPQRQARYAKRTTFQNNSSLLQNMWKKTKCRLWCPCRKSSTKIVMYGRCVMGSDLKLG